MIIEYDRAPGLTPTQRLDSLAASVQRALEELVGDASEVTGKAIDLSNEKVDFTDAESVGDLTSGDTLSKLFGQTSKNLKDHTHEEFATDVTFKGDILIDDPELESLWNGVFGGLTHDIINFIYPIGSVIASVNSSFDPNTAYKHQTWVRFAEGRTLVGADSSDEDFSTAEKTGGEKTHTLTANEIPEHGNHLYTSFPGGHGNTAVYLSASTMSAYGTVARGWNNLNGGEMYPAGYLIGGSKPHNNMQPYTTVYYWKRVA